MSPAEFDWKMRRVCRQATVALALVAAAIVLGVSARLTAVPFLGAFAKAVLIVALLVATSGPKPVDPAASNERDWSEFE